MRVCELCVVSYVSAPSVRSGGLVVCERLLEEARRYRGSAEASTRVDKRSTCTVTTSGRQRRDVLGGRARQIGFGAVYRRRPRVEDAGLVSFVGIERSSFEKSADGKLQIGLNGRSVPDQTNEQVCALCVVSANEKSWEQETETVVGLKREREAVWRQSCAEPQIGYHLWPGIGATKTTVKTGRGGQ